jgi:hypothetical protein
MGRSGRNLVCELAVWLAIAGAAYGLSFQFNAPIASYRFGATGWPRTIILLIVVFALLQFLMQYMQLLRRREPVQHGGEPASTRADDMIARLINGDIKGGLVVLATFGLPLLYLLLLPRTGFYLTTPFFLATYLYLLGERRWYRLIGVAFVIYALIVLLFTTIFYVALPVGNWPLFYDINNWMLVRLR